MGFYKTLIKKEKSSKTAAGLPTPVQASYALDIQVNTEKKCHQERCFFWKE